MVCWWSSVDHFDGGRKTILQMWAICKPERGKIPLSKSHPGCKKSFIHINALSRAQIIQWSKRRDHGSCWCHSSSFSVRSMCRNWLISTQLKLPLPPNRSTVWPFERIFPQTVVTRVATLTTVSWSCLGMRVGVEILLLWHLLTSVWKASQPPVIV